jgi:hypothetical protein
MKKKFLLFIVLLFAAAMVFALAACSLGGGGGGGGNGLSAPENLRLDGDTLRWNSVVGATSYIVKLNNNEYPASTIEFKLNLPAGDHVAAVRALGTGNQASPFSADFNFTIGNVIDGKGGTLTEAQFNQAILGTLQHVANASLPFQFNAEHAVTGGSSQYAVMFYKNIVKHQDIVENYQNPVHNRNIESYFEINENNVVHFWNENDDKGWFFSQTDSLFAGGIPQRAEISPIISWLLTGFTFSDLTYTDGRYYLAESAFPSGNVYPIDIIEGMSLVFANGKVSEILIAGGFDGENGTMLITLGYENTSIVIPQDVIDNAKPDNGNPPPSCVSCGNNPCTCTQPSNHLGFYQFLMLAVESMDKAIAQATSNTAFYAQATIVFDLVIGDFYQRHFEIDIKGIFCEADLDKNEAYLRVREGGFTMLYLYAKGSQLFVGQRLDNGSMDWSVLNQLQGDTKVMAQFFAGIPSRLSREAEDEFGIAWGFIESLLFIGDTMPGVMDILARLGDPLLSPAGLGNTSAPVGFIKGTGPGSLRGSVTPAGWYGFSFPFEVVGHLLTDLGGAIDGLGDFIFEMLENSFINNELFSLLFNNSFYDILTGTAQNEFPELSFWLSIGGGKTFDALFIEYANLNSPLGDIMFTFGISDVFVSNKAIPPKGWLKPLSMPHVDDIKPMGILLRTEFSLPELDMSVLVELSIFPNFVIEHNDTTGEFYQNWEDFFATITFDVLDFSDRFPNMGNFIIQGSLFYIGNGQLRAVLDLTKLFDHAGIVTADSIFYVDISIDAFWAMLFGADDDIYAAQPQPQRGSILDIIFPFIFNANQIGVLVDVEFFEGIFEMLGLHHNDMELEIELEINYIRLNFVDVFEFWASLHLTSENNLGKNYALSIKQRLADIPENQMVKLVDLNDCCVCSWCLYDCKLANPWCFYDCNCTGLDNWHGLLGTFNQILRIFLEID